MSLPKLSRSCMGCTACCDGWLQMMIGDAHVHPGCPCPYSTGSGCSNYENRPKDPCINFNCGWVIENSPLPEWMKPNNSKVIVIFNKLQWQGVAVDLAVPVGEKIPQESLAWLMQFSAQHYRPLIYMEQQMENGQFNIKQQVFGYGPPAFQADLVQWQKEGRKLW